MFLSLLTTFTLTSCNAQVPAIDGPIAPQDRYVLDYRTTKTFGDVRLEKRISLIAPISSIYFSKFIGINDLDVFALYFSGNEFSIPNSYGKIYIQKSDFHRFYLGEALIDNSKAELISEKTGEAVGTVAITKENFPTYPGSILELCSGTYEDKCILSYSNETQNFSIKMKE